MNVFQVSCKLKYAEVMVLASSGAAQTFGIEIIFSLNLGPPPPRRLSEQAAAVLTDSATRARSPDPIRVDPRPPPPSVGTSLKAFWCSEIAFSLSRMIEPCCGQPVARKLASTSNEVSHYHRIQGEVASSVLRASASASSDGGGGLVEREKELRFEALNKAIVTLIRGAVSWFQAEIGDNEKKNQRDRASVTLSAERSAN
ncbi:hypothetical protein EVAR_76642_1 [Eumeta japonica]|uniref:Uncharacterized protein n=1 Tax=Eumeta variegata TaxID=151549 RepID=A0A4C1T7Z4_EUMVA|nr:hypothetical protein EVAR_76642_1 [Eumeta japonica]